MTFLNTVPDDLSAQYHAMVDLVERTQSAMTEFDRLILQRVPWRHPMHVCREYAFQIAFLRLSDLRCQLLPQAQKLWASAESIALTLNAPSADSRQEAVKKANVLASLDLANKAAELDHQTSFEYLEHYRSGIACYYSAISRAFETCHTSDYSSCATAFFVSTQLAGLQPLEELHSACDRVETLIASAENARMAFNNAKSKCGTEQAECAFDVAYLRSALLHDQLVPALTTLEQCIATIADYRASLVDVGLHVQAELKHNFVYAVERLKAAQSLKRELEQHYSNRNDPRKPEDQFAGLTRSFNQRYETTTKERRYVTVTWFWDGFDTTDKQPPPPPYMTLKEAATAAGAFIANSDTVGGSALVFDAVSQRWVD